MRLIDADALLERMTKDPLFPLVERYGVSGVINAEPTVDAVNVVRCKDCRHWVDKYRCQEYGRIHQICEVTPNLWTGETYFCALGERRENDGSD